MANVRSGYLIWPSAPLGVSAVPVPGKAGVVEVAFSRPASEGGSPLKHYLVQYGQDTGSWEQEIVESDATRPSVQIQGLTVGTRFVTRVTAVNGAGEGAWSPVTRTVVEGEDAAVELPPSAASPVPLSLPPGRAETSWEHPASLSEISEYRLRVAPLAALTQADGTFPEEAVERLPISMPSPTSLPEDVFFNQEAERILNETLDEFGGLPPEPVSVDGSALGRFRQGARHAVVPCVQ